jgi:hypothetical protein
VEKDKRFELIKIMISAGRIQKLEDIFNYIPKTVVAKSIGISNSRFNKLIKHVGGFALRDLYILADLTEIDPLELFDLIHAQKAANLKGVHK